MNQPAFMTPASAVSLLLYLGVLLALMDHTPARSQLMLDQPMTLLLGGALGLWRYGWWLLNLYRSLLYRFVVFPGWRRQVNPLREGGWRHPGMFIS